LLSSIIAGAEINHGKGGFGCGAILVHRRAWPHPLHVAGAIQAGVHQIACGDADYFIGFSIEPGTTFHFDYWGP